MAATLVFDQRTYEHAPRLEVVWADGTYHNHAQYDWLAERELSWRPEIVSRPRGVKGFVLLPKLWGAERSFA